MCHITHSYLHQIVLGTPCDDATANDFLKALHLALELLKPLGRMTIHANSKKDSQWIAKFLRISLRLVACDDMGVF